MGAVDWGKVSDLIRGFASKRGYKGKVIAKCIDCSYDPLDKGNWRQQVERCGCPDCPLYSIRPVSRGGK